MEAVKITSVYQDATYSVVSVVIQKKKNVQGKEPYLFKEMIYVRALIYMIHCTPPIHHHLDSMALLGPSIAKHTPDTKTQQPTTARAATRVMDWSARRVYERLV